MRVKGSGDTGDGYRGCGRRLVGIIMRAKGSGDEGEGQWSPPPAIFWTIGWSSPCNPIIPHVYDPIAL